MLTGTVRVGKHLYKYTLRNIPKDHESNPQFANQKIQEDAETILSKPSFANAKRVRLIYNQTVSGNEIVAQKLSNDASLPVPAVEVEEIYTGDSSSQIFNSSYAELERAFTQSRQAQQSTNSASGPGTRDAQTVGLSSMPFMKNENDSCFLSSITWSNLYDRREEIRAAKIDDSSPQAKEKKEALKLLKEFIEECEAAKEDGRIVAPGKISTLRNALVKLGLKHFSTGQQDAGEALIAFESLLAESSHKRTPIVRFREAATASSVSGPLELTYRPLEDRSNSAAPKFHFQRNASVNGLIGELIAPPPTNSSNTIPYPIAKKDEYPDRLTFVIPRTHLEGSRPHKITGRVQADPQLSLPARDGTHTKYRLAATVHHRGDATGGHYYTYRHKADGGMILYDDLKSGEIPLKKDEAERVINNANPDNFGETLYIVSYEKESSLLDSSPSRTASADTNSRATAPSLPIVPTTRSSASADTNSRATAASLPMVSTTRSNASAVVDPLQDAMLNLTVEIQMVDLILKDGANASSSEIQDAIKLLEVHMDKLTAAEVSNASLASTRKSDLAQLRQRAEAVKRKGEKKLLEKLKDISMPSTPSASASISTGSGAPKALYVSMHSGSASISTGSGAPKALYVSMPSGSASISTGSGAAAPLAKEASGVEFAIALAGATDGNSRLRDIQVAIATIETDLEALRKARASLTAPLTRAREGELQALTQRAIEAKERLIELERNRTTASGSNASGTGTPSGGAATSASSAPIGRTAAAPESATVSSSPNYQLELQNLQQRIQSANVTLRELDPNVHASIPLAQLKDANRSLEEGIRAADAIPKTGDFSKVEWAQKINEAAALKARILKKIRELPSSRPAISSVSAPSPDDLAPPPELEEFRDAELGLAPLGLRDIASTDKTVLAALKGRVDTALADVTRRIGANPQPDRQILRRLENAKQSYLRCQQAVADKMFSLGFS